MKCTNPKLVLDDSRLPSGNDGRGIDPATHTVASKQLPSDAKGRVTPSRLLEKLESQQFRCFLTGWPLTPETAGVDHIIPISQGGQHEMWNIAIVDSRVNNAKNTMGLPEFIELCSAVTQWNAQKLAAGDERPHT